MSKKPRPKKKYRPRPVSVPSYIATFDNSVGKPQDHGRAEDQVFLLRIANRTATDNDLIFHCQMIRAAWILAEIMEDSSRIRHCLYDGIEAIGAYLTENQVSFTDEYFEKLSQAMEVGRSIFENSSKLERTQALSAVMDDRFTLSMMQMEQKHLSDQK